LKNEPWNQRFSGNPPLKHQWEASL